MSPLAIAPALWALVVGEVRTLRVVTRTRTAMLAWIALITAVGPADAAGAVGPDDGAGPEAVGDDVPGLPPEVVSVTPGAPLGAGVASGLQAATISASPTA